MYFMYGLERFLVDHAYNAVMAISARQSGGILQGGAQRWNSGCVKFWTNIMSGGASSLLEYLSRRHLATSWARVFAVHNLPSCLWVHVNEKVVVNIQCSSISMWLSSLMSKAIWRGSLQNHNCEEAWFTCNEPAKRKKAFDPVVVVVWLKSF